MDDRPPDIIVIAGGAPVASATVADVDPAGPWLVAADSGLDRAAALGWAEHVDVVIGDLDSVSHQELDAATVRGAEIRPYAPDKDVTDLELALLAAADHAPGAEVLALCVTGARPDHELANLMALAAEPFAGLRLRWLDDAGAGWVVRDERRLAVTEGATISVIPIHGPAVVSLDGFWWPLDRHRVEPGSSLGVSNLATSRRPVVTVHDGVVLVFVTPAEGASP